MNIGDIIWPSDPKAAFERYLTFVIKIAASLELTYVARRRDPIEVAKGYLAGTISQGAYEAERALWWSEIERAERHGSRSKKALANRMAIMLVGKSPRDEHDYADHLDWLFQLLDLMHVGTAHARREMYAHFEFRESPPEPPRRR